MTIITVRGRQLRIHDREEWQTAAQPVTGPKPYPDLVHHAVIHWPGNPDNWVPPQDVAAHLRAAHAAYLRTKGYSYGYGFVIGPNPINWDADVVDTDIWEVRGTDIRIASNDGDIGVYGQYSNPNFNGRSNSAQIMASTNHPATADQIEQSRWWVAWMDDVYRETVTVIPHNTSDATQCPGDLLTSKIPLIATRPAVKPLPGPNPKPEPAPQPEPPEPEPAPEEDDMSALIITAVGGKTSGAIAVTDPAMTTKRFIHGEDAAALQAVGYKTVRLQGDIFDAIPGDTPIWIVNPPD